MGDGNGWDEHKRLIYFRLDQAAETQKANHEEIMRALKEISCETGVHRSGCEKRFDEIEKKITNAKSWAIGLSSGISGTFGALWHFFGG